MQTALGIAGVLALFVFSGSAGYTMARLELAKRYAPRHPDLPGLERLASYSMALALGATVFCLAVVIF